MLLQLSEINLLLLIGKLNMHLEELDKVSRLGSGWVFSSLSLEKIFYLNELACRLMCKLDALSHRMGQVVFACSIVPT